MEILRALQPPQVPVDVTPAWRIQRRGLVVLASGFAVLVVGTALAAGGSRALQYGVLALAAAMMLTGITLIILGPIRDRGQTP